MCRRPFFRAVPTALAIIYFVTNCAFAHTPETSMWEERRRAADDRAADVTLGRLPLSASTHPAQIFRRLPSIKPSLPQQIEKPLSKQAASHLAPLIQHLPAAYGTVRKVTLPNKATNGKTIIHIQDVHMNAEAQRNIGQT